MHDFYGAAMRAFISVQQYFLNNVSSSSTFCNNCTFFLQEFISEPLAIKHEGTVSAPEFTS